MKPLRFADHEIFIAYHAKVGVLQWTHTDGRTGSDPVQSNMTDDEAVAVAESKATTLGDYSFLNIPIED